MNYYDEIKNSLIDNEVNRMVKNYSKNKKELEAYFRVGKLLNDAGKHYGEGIIKEYSKKLTEELGKGYTISSLKRMRQFYFFQKGAPLSDLLTWSHYCELLPLKDVNEINYYIRICKDQHLSKRALREKIKNKEYKSKNIVIEGEIVKETNIVIDENNLNSKEEYYNEIKEELINNEVNKYVKDYSINKTELKIYYNVGKLLNDAGKHYGEGIIKEYSKKLTEELGRKYNERTLRRFKQFYKLFKDQKGAPLSTILSWSHYCELIPLKDINKINYYINVCIKNNLTVRELRERIKSGEYERLPIETKKKLINNIETNIKDNIPNPILIKNKNNIEIITEKALHSIILEDILSFIKSLGNGYSFVDSEYKIKIGNRYNYIDILLFNIEYNCYVVVELKVTEIKKEHIGQIEIYMNYIDNNIKKINHDKTIGVIICKKNNKFVMEYCSDKRILSRMFEIIP